MIVENAQLEYQAAASIRDSCFAQDGSYLFPGEKIWTPKTIHAIVDGMQTAWHDTGKGSFLVATKHQLSSLPVDCTKLVADALVLYNLFPYDSNVNKVTKEKQITEVLSWKGLPPPEILNSTFGKGIGDVGTFYLTAKDQIIRAFLLFAARGKERGTNFNSADECQGLLETLRTTDRIAGGAPNVLLYLLFPEEYEAIASTKAKRAIVAYYTGNKDGNIDLDKSLREIRATNESRLGERFSFYSPSVKAEWEPGTSPKRLERKASSSKPLVDLAPDGGIEDAPILELDSLVLSTYWTEAALSLIIDAIRNSIAPSRQVIFAGPPGTSKTYVAQELIAYLTDFDPSRSTIVQFHPSYSYEQFIEGLRPTIVDGAVKFDVVAGIVLEMAAKCRASEKAHFLLIDELNRANLPRVLGELMYLFEYRDKKIDLPYTRGFSLPPNLYFIGTMNTADRNIRSIDIALRRRFDVFMCPPDPEVLTRYYADTEKHLNDVPDLIPGFVNLNERLEKELDEHHTIGHAFFMSSHFTPSELQATWTRKIQPLLSEYFFASPDIAQQFVLSDFWPSLA